MQSAVCQIRANAPEARFKALYPPGFQVFSRSIQALSSILDARLQLADMARTIRDILIQFVLSTYSGIMSDTYRVPRKPPVSHKHPDKALVRAREGESRVSMALECLSVVGQEAMLIVSDYHYENFLKNLNVKSVVPADRGHVTDLLTRFAASKMFGDFDMLVFHPKCGVFVIGLCSVNSNSDVQYILKRLQKARVQLDKSRSVAERAVRFLGLDCPVAAIFSTPNLKRSFLNKVTARDKSLHRSLGTLNVIALDELPLQFRSQWSSQQHFDLLTQWWTKVKADQMVKCQLSAEQFSILVGSFLCPIVSSVDFEQGQQAPPSDCHMPSFENQSGKETGAGKQAISTITTVTTKVSSCGYAGYDILDMPMSKDTRGDEGENRVVSAIEILGLKYEAVKPVFIICDFQYNNYLNKLEGNYVHQGR
nr:hypothetical protein BaRGS_017362 [Batillaria attramentaria]